MGNCKIVVATIIYCCTFQYITGRRCILEIRYLSVLRLCWVSCSCIQRQREPSIVEQNCSSKLCQFALSDYVLHCDNMVIDLIPGVTNLAKVLFMLFNHFNLFMGYAKPISSIPIYPLYLFRENIPRQEPLLSSIFSGILSILNVYKNDIL